MLKKLSNWLIAQNFKKKPIVGGNPAIDNNWKNNLTIFSKLKPDVKSFNL